MEDSLESGWGAGAHHPDGVMKPVGPRGWGRSPCVNLVKITPMAIVMVAGPQILSAIFLATSENWRRNSAAYVAGASSPSP